MLDLGSVAIFILAAVGVGAGIGVAGLILRDR